TFKGSFFDQETQKAIVAKITSENQTYFAEGKEFLINLPSGNEYQFTIEAKGYRSQTETLNLATVKTEGRIVRDIFLEKIKEEILTFENITFISNDTILHDESFEDLNKIVALIESQPEISMEISSHTDNIGSEENNKKLSKARAEVIFRYFVNHGISPDRLVIQWFGESRPIASNDTEDGRKKNRRVEFKIIRE
ncbi:MAG: OmpA family protein, partial [Thermodesulfobacteriota bacterium]